MEIDATAAHGFQAGADAYARARPDYPADAIAWLRRRLRLPTGSRVLDVGAGTGKLTALLQGGGADVYALEPVEAMRTRLATTVPEAHVAAGVAEAIPFRPGSFNAVVAAQAFHWFDGPRALGEFHRVLTHDGAVALVWNARDRSVDWIREFSKLVDVYGDAIRRHENEEWKSAFPAPGFGPLEEMRFANPQTITPEGIADRVASTSFVALLDGDEREALLARVRELLRTHPATTGRTKLLFPHITRVYVCDRR